MCVHITFKISKNLPFIDKLELIIKLYIFEPATTQNYLKYKTMEADYTQNANQQNSPSIWSNAGKFGIKGAKYFAFTLLLTGLVNTIFLIISIIKFYPVETTAKYVSGIIVIIAIGVLCTVGGMFLTYKYLLMDGLKVLYSHLAPFFKKLSTVIIDKISDVATNKVHITGQHIEKAFNIGNIIVEVYGNKVPKFAQKGITFMVKRIPFADLIGEAKDSLKDQDKEKASNLLYSQIDNYINTSILGGSSMKFLYWLIPLNIVLQSVAIYLIIQYYVPIIPKEHIF